MISSAIMLAFSLITIGVIQEIYEALRARRKRQRVEPCVAKDHFVRSYRRTFRPFPGYKVRPRHRWRWYSGYCDHCGVHSVCAFGNIRDLRTGPDGAVTRTKEGSR